MSRTAGGLGPALFKGLKMPALGGGRASGRGSSSSVLVGVEAYQPVFVNFRNSTVAAAVMKGYSDSDGYFMFGKQCCNGCRTLSLSAQR